MAKLTAKQQRFVEEYLVDLNATQAAIRAGYSAKTAEVIGFENLRKPKIQELINKAMQGRSERTEITADRVLQEYARLGFFDPRKLFNDDGSPKGIHELDDETAAVLAGLDVIEIWEGKGEDRHFVGYLKKYKLADKKGALDSIARHLGMFNDRLEFSGQVNTNTDKLDAILEQLKDDG
ncbi:MAG TPA: terminase small subunit [Syntrophomonas sp.]|nr:terminase small subunit [Syntrophomonas sp.]